MDIQIEQVVSQILAFLIMFWVLKRYAWKPVLSFMEERRKKIQLDFETIDAQKNEVSQLKALYEGKLRGIEAEARQKTQTEIAKGQKTLQKMQEDAHREAKGILDKAHREAELEIVKAKNQLKGDLVNIVMETTEKVLQEKLKDEKHQTELIQKMLAQVEFK